MKLLIHIIKKDARGLGRLWCFWILLIAAQVGCAMALSSPETLQLTRYQYLQGYLYGLGVAWMLAAYLLAGAVILQDPPAGTKIFWATRPISGGMLLRAKLSAILVFLVITPAVVWLPWRIASGFDAFDLLNASLKTMELAFFAVVPAVVIAAISGDGRRFMLYNVVGLAALGTLAMVLGLRNSGEASGVFFTRLWVGLIVTVAFAAIAVVTQYRTRRWGRSAAQLLSGLVLGSATAAFLPYDGSALFRHAPHNVGFADKIRLEASISRLDPRAESEGPREVSVIVKVEGAPINVALGEGHADLELSWSDGTHYVVRNLDLWPVAIGGSVEAAADVLGMRPFGENFGPRSKKEPLKDAFLKAHGDSEPAALPANHEHLLRYRATLWMDPATAKKYTETPPSCSLMVMAKFLAPEVAFQVPLAAGNKGAGAGLSANVLATGIVHNEQLNITLFGAWIERDHSPDTDTRLFGIVSGEHGGVLDLEGGVMDFYDPNIAFEPMDRLHVSIAVPKASRDNQSDEVTEYARQYMMAGIRFRVVGGIVRTIQPEITVTASQ